MGLYVGFAYDVKIHECKTKKASGEISFYVLIQEDEKPFGKCVSSLTSCIEEPYHHLFKKVVEPVYSCECDEEELDRVKKHIKTINAGYHSFFHESGGIKPGEIVEYEESDGFYYGPYSKWTREVENGKVDMFRRMSDCDGFYVGEFVEMMRDELLSVDVTYKDLTENQQEYLSMLRNIPEESIKRCLITHC